MTSILDTNSGRFLLLKSLVCSPIVAIVGHTQVGKSTFLYWLATELQHFRYALRMNKEMDWDYTKYCCKSFDDFKDTVTKSNHSVVAVEEASFQLDSAEYWNLENKLFKVIMDTQGFRRNIYLLCFPSLKGIAKQHRLAIDFIFSVERKNEMLRYVLIKPNYIKKQFWKLSDKNFKQVWLNKFVVEYSREFLLESQKYTDWLKEFKVDIMKNVEDRYSKKKNKGKIELGEIIQPTIYTPITVTT